MRDFLARAWFWIDENIVKAILTVIFVAILVVVLWPLSVIYIPAGHVGVLWSRFSGGTDMSKVYAEGTRVILPWDTMTIYDARFQLQTEDFDVLSVDGLRSKVSIAFRYRIHADYANLLHKLIGPDYVKVLLSNDIGSQARHVFARYKPEDAFTVQRSAIEDFIFQESRRDLNKEFGQVGIGRLKLIELDEVMLVGIELPKSVAESIERKNEEYHRAEQYTFKLEVERREAQRKEIEARGIRTFQDIVKDGLTDHYLRWRGIEATTSLAQSPNAKMVIMGSGPTGLPILLGNMTDSQPAGTVDAAPAANGAAAPTVRPADAGEAAKAAPAAQPGNAPSVEKKPGPKAEAGAPPAAPAPTQ
ncbi:prohibitin family protein [Ferrovibrio sp.]|uniref:prohibitin family protein n=1 Tax=Ferrovibrio sp. TaxID=1917215 RepID=UPI001B7318BA|nr:prohibitin family protein [Ferrovibrio sp.]MBP7063498.1 prohibitin family protein [Ferrovibrio sp.]